MKEPVLGGIIIMVVTYVILRLIYHIMTRSDIPPSCQLFGGQWDAWSGWRNC